MQQCQAEHYVQCLECEGATALFSSRREARELWNRRAALTPPEGYVLVQEAPLRHLLSDAITSVEFIAGRGQSKPLSRRVGDRAWALIEALAQAGGKHAG
jgi:hypothetical protein